MEREERKEILGVRMACVSAKEAMKQAVGYFATETLDIIEIMSMSMLLEGQENASWRKAVCGMSLVLPGEEEIVEAAGISEYSRLKEARESVFLRMFLRFLQRNRKNVFLLADTEEECRELKEKIGWYNAGIRVSGYAALEGREAEEERVINQINGTETECIISMLASPYQEKFIASNRALLNAKVWLGCGQVIKRSYEDRKLFNRLRHFWLKSRFRYNVGKQKNEAETVNEVR